MAPSYTVTAPLVVVPDESGADRYLYKGAPVPGDIAKEHTDRLAAEGLIEETSTPAVAATTDEDEPPAKSASKADWEAYARSQGATDADLDGATKDDLVATYGE
jgi:hypothetical protein